MMFAGRDFHRLQVKCNLCLHNLRACPPDKMLSGNFFIASVNLLLSLCGPQIKLTYVFDDFHC